MSGLVPEHRMDKNGVTQRKWVRPQAPAGAGAGSIPAPAMGFAAAAEPDDDALREEARTDLYRIDRDLYWADLNDDEDEDEFGANEFRSKVDDILALVGGATAMSLADLCGEYHSETATTLMTDGVLALLYDPRIADDAKDSAVQNYLSVIAGQAEWEDEDNGMYVPLYALMVLDVLDRAEVATPFSAEQVEAYRQAVRAVNVIADRSRTAESVPGLARNENGYYAPTGPETVRVLREHHARAVEIVDALVERGSFDAADARAVAEAGPLGRGHL